MATKDGTNQTVSAKDVLNQAAEGFIASIQEVHRSNRDKEQDPVKVAANRIKAREIASVYAERLVDAARTCRGELYTAKQDQLAAKGLEIEAAAKKILDEHDKTISTMRSLYGERGVNYGMGHLSIAEQEATARLTHLRGEADEMEREANAILAHQEHQAAAVCRMSSLSAADPMTLASYSKAYVAAAVAGELVD